MYHELSKKEIKAFIKKYMNPFDEYTKEIRYISVIEYNGVREYLINHKYILKVHKWFPI